ncbi:MAG: hypothetical protein FWE17_01850, partial [Alphaproteobacteria bacterium]|nr:hypothetical protein [Alphaproteobacteria bacterium]
MLRLKRYFTDIKKASVLYALCSVLFVCGFAANASPNMSHTVSVKTEAASASAARTAAHIQARRAAFENVLVRYAAWPEIERLSAETRDSDILNLVGTMS